jgi:Raf kinase inhibitor-like YbhB/YbcL family protein
MLRAMKTTISFSLAFGLALVGCGSNNSKPTIDAPAGQPGPGPGGNEFTLTTTAFKPGGAIPDANTCNGANTSPDLAWTNPPAGTKSFAVSLVDKSAPFTHWVIYDIAATATSLPANVDKEYMPTNVTGAKQTHSGANTQVIGYFGPCPPMPPAHTYQFSVYALDVATLPGVSGQSTASDGLAAIATHQIATASFTGDYLTPAKP